ncbi:hypothetical protein C4D60_Mb09t18090 [Musa balbisiana]|uniref:Cyclin-D1-binding protein 1-like C-terminal domain-containing protein n=1 Tax=Musa balbisiana TaxID=52838 RepID=A0A4S8IHB5_MUSBA|nr:hypothetical protein C4D60_Mb09t18090 [Musa balbisiana]
MEELKEHKRDPSDDSGNGLSSKADESTSLSDEWGDLTEADIDDDLSAEEMVTAQLIISVVSDTLTVVKELIRFVTGLIKSSSHKSSTKESVDSFEKLVTHCQEMGTQVNELGASVYPPQETAQMKMSAKKMYCLVHEMHIEVRNLEGTPDGVFGTCKILENSLRNLQQGLDGDLINEMGTLSV